MAAAISCEATKGPKFRLGVPHSLALQPLVQSNKPWWIAPPSNTVSEYMMVPTGIHLPCCHPASSSATYHPMASSIMVKSLDLSESLVDEREALATYRRLAEESSLSEKIATLLVNNMGRKKLEDLEDLSEPQVEDKIIPAITQLDTPLVMGSRLKSLSKHTRGSRGLMGAEAEDNSGG